MSDDSWAYSRAARRSDPLQGWKLHVSATILSASEVFVRTEPVLRRHDALFKVPCRLELLRSLNSGLSNFSQIGKFLTVYPRSTAEALELARDLHDATRNLPGPRVPFDAQYRKGSLVYYRYGAFRSRAKAPAGNIRDPKGKRHRDKRAPGRAVPRWLQDPFQGSPPNNSNRRGLISQELLVFRAKAQRGKGGVYEALDLSVLPVRRVIIKEGRRHGETDWKGKDGYALVKHEAQVLRKLRKAGLPVPEVLREFDKNGNRYLVLERIVGQPLLGAKRLQPPRPSCRGAERILRQLGPILSKMHAAGWAWRDCKPSHIFRQGGKLGLIDFEGACRIDQTKVLPWGSPDYVSPRSHARFSRDASTQEDDYALGVIAFQFLSGEFPPVEKRGRAAHYRRTNCPKALRERIEQLIDSTI